MVLTFQHAVCALSPQNIGDNACAACKFCFTPRATAIDAILVAGPQQTIARVTTMWCAETALMQTDHGTGSKLLGRGNVLEISSIVLAVYGGVTAWGGVFLR